VYKRCTKLILKLFVVTKNGRAGTRTSSNTLCLHCMQAMNDTVIPRFY